MTYSLSRSHVLVLIFLGAAVSGCAPDDAERPGEGPPADWPDQLASPIEGATFSLAARQLPGAPREDRAGVHQGFDFVNGMTGRPLSPDERVVAVADGEILRIDHDYGEPDPETLAYWSQQAAEPGFVGAYARDRLRGRQVWVRHEDGHVSRYAHLSQVNPDLQPGAEVVQGQPVGLMGKSGKPPAEDEPAPVPYLHFELWSPDRARYLGQDLDPLEIHRHVRALFGEQALPRHARAVLTAVDAGEDAPETWPPTEFPESGFSVNPPAAMVAGSAFAVPVTWEGDAFGPADFFALLAGRPMGVIDAGDGAWILAAVPLGFDGEEAQMVIGAADAYGQSLAGSRAIEVTPRENIPAPVQVPAEILDRYTEESLARENQHLGRAALDSMQRKQPNWQESFDAPLEGEVFRRFGQEAFHALLRPAHPLPGIAIRAAAGSPVQATNAGTVALVEDLPVRGRTVVLDHGGGVTSLYGHLADTDLVPGEEVRKGQPIGRVGNSGAAAEPQLRLEIQVAGIPSDPLDWLGQTLPNRQPPPSD